MPLFLKHRVCLIHIPKCGGTSFARAMKSLGDPPVYYSEKFNLIQSHPAEHSPQHATYTELQNMNMLPNGFEVIAVTRDPIQRFLSEYRWRLKIHSIDRRVSQDDFADAFFAPGTFWDNHQKSQADFMRSGESSIKRVRIDDLSAYFKSKFQADLPIENSTSAGERVITDYAKRLVEKHWQEDFQ